MQNSSDPQDDLPLNEQEGWKNGYIKEQLAKKHWTEQGFEWWFGVIAVGIVWGLMAYFKSKT